MNKKQFNDLTKKKIEKLEPKVRKMYGSKGSNQKMTKRLRGFEIDKLGLQYEKKTGNHIKLPRRATSGSAGYDIRSIDDVTVPTYSGLLEEKFNQKSNISFGSMKDVQKFTKWCREQNLVTLVHTGIKVYCQPNEWLLLANRSSNPVKRGLILANGVGVTDSDYYSNPKNDGELCAEFINLGLAPYHIHQGDRIMQGLFEPYLLADNDNPVSKIRKGGIGSTGKR